MMGVRLNFEPNFNHSPIPNPHLLPGNSCIALNIPAAFFYSQIFFPFRYSCLEDCSWSGSSHHSVGADRWRLCCIWKEKELRPSLDHGKFNCDFAVAFFSRVIVSGGLLVSHLKSTNYFIPVFAPKHNGRVNARLHTVPKRRQKSTRLQTGLW